MTYKETLFFIGKCLTINHENQNKLIVQEKLKSQSVDWDEVVKVSTSHYVFPALYCNLKKADFITYLPEDLVEYMKHITDLNRERNQQIIEQAKEINSLLLENNITPIFLKGTGNLLEGLYEDIAERMVGDIDFLVDEKDYNKSITIFYENGYTEAIESDFHMPNFRHYNRLKKEERIAGIEIHKEMTKKQYADEFNFKSIVDATFSIDNISFLSFQDQLRLSIIAFQVNDNGQYFKSISLRNAYDVFLLSQKTDSIKSIATLKEKLQIPLNNFLTLVARTLNASSVKNIDNSDSEKYHTKYLELIENRELGKKFREKTSRKLFLKERLQIILKAFYKKGYAIWLFNRLLKGRVDF